MVGQMACDHYLLQQDAGSFQICELHIHPNVMWVVAQVLNYNDPNFNVHEFAEAAGIPDSIRLTSTGKSSGGMPFGLRKNMSTGEVSAPGNPNYPG